MKLIKYFDSFLAETVNLNQSRLDNLESRVKAIVTYLESDSELGSIIKGHDPQGSWAHRTIIKPLDGKEFDADILLQLEEQSDWEEDPAEYPRQVHAALKRSSTYKSMVKKKNRCVRIAYSNDCHVDVVPYIVIDEEKEVIVNCDENDFEDTNPQGFTVWMKEKDDLANGNLRKVIRLMKYLRDYKTTFSAPSVILTVMFGRNVQTWNSTTRYSDLPTALVHLLEDLDAWLQLYPDMPTLDDPSCPGTSFNHRWDQDRYANFRNQVARYAEWARDAYDEENKTESILKWQKLFGTDFKTPIANNTSNNRLPARTSMLPAPHEEFIEQHNNLTWNGGYTATLHCKVLSFAGFRHGQLRKMRHVQRGRKLRFEVKTDAPADHDIYWKVRNDGEEARSASQLRGQIFKGGRFRDESTKYRGRHFVECYVVKNGKVLATDHMTVEIR